LGSPGAGLMLAGCTNQRMMSRLSTGDGRDGWVARSNGSLRLSWGGGRRRSRVKVRVGGVGDVVCLVRAALSDWRSGGRGCDRDEAANQSRSSVRDLDLLLSHATWTSPRITSYWTRPNPSRGSDIRIPLSVSRHDRSTEPLCVPSRWSSNWSRCRWR